MTRIYQNTALAENMMVQLDEPASHYLARVLRAKIHDAVTLFNGKGGEYEGVVVQIEKKYVTIQLESFIPRDVESSLDILLAQGISRGEKMDYTIQKAVELGVKTIAPLFTEYCNVKLDLERAEKKQLHWQGIVKGACEQSGRNYMPEVLLPQSMDKWAETVKADGYFILSPYAKQTLSSMPITKTAKIVLLVGPEGGLSEKEVDRLSKRGFLPLSLGPRVLRTETAAVAALAALQCYFGDMG